MYLGKIYVEASQPASQKVAEKIKVLLEKNDFARECSISSLRDVDLIRQFKYRIIAISLTFLDERVKGN